jgi:predicted neutral ceramidase superfamily lipid hydrolase
VVSLSGLNADLLEEMPVDRPGFSAVLLVVGISLMSLTLIVSKVRSPKRIVLSLIAVTCVLSVLSGLYLNQANLVNDVYVLKSALYVETSLGYQIDWYGLFANRAATIRFGEKGALPVMEVLPRDLRGADYASGHGGASA